MHSVKINSFYAAIALCLIMILSGCLFGNKAPEEAEDKYSKYIGSWEHYVHPEMYTIEILSLEEDNIEIDIQSLSSTYRVAFTSVTEAVIEDNRVKFSFIDSFQNTGTGVLILMDDTISVLYNTDKPYKDWCVDAGTGAFKKVTESDEINNK